MLANLISHTLICHVGKKKKIENFHVLDIHSLYRMSRYASVKVDITEHNDITRRHGIVIAIWRTSAIKVTIKNPLSEMNGVLEKESIMGARDS